MRDEFGAPMKVSEHVLRMIGGIIVGRIIRRQRRRSVAFPMILPVTILPSLT
jgi:hypothetical protein